MDPGLQFDRAEFSTGAGAGAACQACQQRLAGSYFQLHGKLLCARCAEGVRQFAMGRGSRFGRFLTAALFGLGAAVAGAAIYWGVLEWLHINAALITILIGFMVGKAVRKGSGGRGGWRYQLLAIFLTYSAIALAYAPALVTAVRDRAVHPHPHAQAAAARANDSLPDSAVGLDTASAKKPAAIEPAASSADSSKPKSKLLQGLPAPLRPVVAVAVLLAICYAMPVAARFPDILNLLIIFFGLMQAWRLNVALKMEMSGPHPLSPGFSGQSAGLTVTGDLQPPASPSA